MLSTFASQFSTEVRREKTAIAFGLTRGVYIFLGFWLVSSLAILLITSLIRLVQQEFTLASSIDFAVVIGYFVAASSFGLPFQQSTSGLGSELFYTVFGSIPLAAVVALLILRRQARLFTSRQPTLSRRNIVVFALSTSIGFLSASLIVVLTLGQLNLGGSVATAPSVKNLLIAGSVLTILGIWFAVGYSPQYRSSVHVWLGQILGQFLRLWFLLLGVVGVLILVFQAIEPDFAVATPDLTIPAWSPSRDQVLAGIVGAILAIALLLLLMPALIFYIVGFSLGGVIGISYDFTSGDDGTSALEVALSLYREIQAQLGIFGVGLPNFGESLGLSIGDINGFVALIALALGFWVAATAGAHLAGVSSNKFEDPILFPKTLIFTTITGFLLYWVFNPGFEASNLGKPSRLAESGTLELVEFQARFGPTSASVLVISVVLALGFYLGGTRWQSSIYGAYYPVLAKLGATRQATLEERQAGALLSWVTVVVLTALVLTPMSIATGERTWAALSGPDVSGARVLELYKTGNIREVKLISSVGSNRWVPDSIMKSAIQIDDLSVSSRTLNNLDKPWQIGDLLATTTHLIGTAEESYLLKISSKGSVDRVWEFDYVSFSPQIQVGAVSLNAPAELLENDKFRFKVNGTEMKTGDYVAVPGKYQVSSTAVGLIAAVDHTYLLSSGGEINVDFGQQFSIPKEDLQKLKDLVASPAKGCSQLDGPRLDHCPSSEEMYASLELAEGARINEGIVYATFTPEQLSRAGFSVQDSKVKNLVACSPAQASVTALYKGSLPTGIKRDFDTAIVETTCEFSLEMTRRIGDGRAVFEVDVFGALKYRYYIAGSLEDGSFVIGELNSIPQN